MYMPTSLHVSASSYEPIVTSNKVLVFFFSPGVFWWYSSDFFLCDDVLVLCSDVHESGCIV